MFATHDTNSGFWIFTVSDPRHDGFRGEVEEDASLDDSVDPAFGDGEPAPEM